ncbi:pyridoxamine 5'-phosphate oxidase family protein [Streptosporangiaceae bacterium NEAU-GS5]|nr:pyridoxamine 5'-phosphate oxidase family protein [Streptosporangiaceae bacterium NEAU-GS5]
MSAARAPDNLGRRVAYHRRRLGLTRAELAGQAKVAEGYVDDLEDQVWPVPMETLERLAAVLQITVYDLLGAGTDQPPGQGPAAARAAIEELTTDACWQLISPGGVGRAGFAGRRGPTVLPVNYRVHEATIVFRTRHGGQLEDDLGTRIEGLDLVIAFEVDRIDEAVRGGWSVLVRGPAHLVAEGELVLSAGADVQPWAGGTRDLYIRITPHEITGRRVGTI